jgi:hypothetical protein
MIQLHENIVCADIYFWLIKICNTKQEERKTFRLGRCELLPYGGHETDEFKFVR